MLNRIEYTGVKSPQYLQPPRFLVIHRYPILIQNLPLSKTSFHFYPLFNHHAILNPHLSLILNIPFLFIFHLIFLPYLILFDSRFFLYLIVPLLLNSYPSFIFLFILLSRFLIPHYFRLMYHLYSICNRD